MSSVSGVGNRELKQQFKKAPTTEEQENNNPELARERGEGLELGPAAIINLSSEAIAFLQKQQSEG